MTQPAGRRVPRTAKLMLTVARVSPRQTPGKAPCRNRNDGISTGCSAPVPTARAIIERLDSRKKPAGQLRAAVICRSRALDPLQLAWPMSRPSVDAEGVKILYLDADLTIHDDLAPIFSLDTKDFPLAAVPSARVETDWNRKQRQTEHAHFRALGMTEPFRYVVLLIDVSHWNSDELTTRTLDFLRRNPTLWRLPDEDALNAVLDGRLAELSPVWNLQAPMWANREVREMVEPVIIHYVGHNKPWRRYRRKMRLMEHRAAYRLYREFVRETPWSAWLSEQWSLRDLRDSLVYERRQLARQIKGRGAADAERRAHIDAYRQYCAQAVFADVEQGIVRRDGGRLRLNKSSGRSATIREVPRRAPKRSTPRFRATSGPCYWEAEFPKWVRSGPKQRSSRCPLSANSGPAKHARKCC